MARQAKAQPQEEVKIQTEIEAIKSRAEKAKRELSDGEKSQIKSLREALGKLRFVRIGNKRIPNALRAVAAIGNLTGANYVSTEAQQKAIVDALRAAVDTLETKLAGKKQTTTGFVLPS